MRVWDQLRQNMEQYGQIWWKPREHLGAPNLIDPNQLNLSRSHSSNTSSMNQTDNISRLCALPSEVLHQVLIYLPAPSLAAVSGTCHTLHEHAINDLLWASLVSENLPETTARLDLLQNFTSYRSLYITHYPYWFLPRHKIWFSDVPYTGKLLIARFDPRTGNIEAYRVLSEQGPHDHEFWDWDPQVSIHRFSPRVRLFLDNPVVALDRIDPTTMHRQQGWWDGELKMSLERKEREGLYSTFFLSRTIPPQLQDPSMALWPPRTIPAKGRVRNESQDSFQGWGHKPQKTSEISETSFRIRNWLEFGRTGNVGVHRVRIGEDVDTYATVAKQYYTPTEGKPYQGIWVGDYSGHGCEFILVMQPDQDGVYKGRLEGVKLTGDANVPRGEFTFFADDIGPGGLIRVAEEKIFHGARIVKSKGHIAGRGFREDTFISSQLILISHDTIAQYWEECGHISYYQRVDIGELLHTGLEADHHSM